jgi:hypothetical protein
MALYKGMGSLNGTSGYSFMVSVVDGAVIGKKVADKVRIMIWSPQGTLVYDNQAGDAWMRRPLQPWAVVILPSIQEVKKAKPMYAQPQPAMRLL